LYHYPATIKDASIATEFAQFAAATADGFKTTSTAGVINKISGRQQVCFSRFQFHQFMGKQLTFTDGILHRFLYRLELDV
jgi:hypothetical protein